MGELLKQLSSREIATLIWIGLFLIWVLDWRGIWTTDFIYSTITWAITFALVAMFEANKLASDRRHMGKVIRDVINVTGVLIFIVEMHSFSLVVELIALPILTVITLMHEMAKSKEEYAAVEKLLGAILTIVGLSYLALSLWQTWAGYEGIKGLGGVDKFEPVSSGGEVDHPEEAVGQLIVTGGDGAVDLELPEHALDAIALLV